MGKRKQLGQLNLLRSDLQSAIWSLEDQEMAISSMADDLITLKDSLQDMYSALGELAAEFEPDSRKHKARKVR